MEYFFPCAYLQERISMPVNSHWCTPRKTEHMLKGFFYRVLKASFEHRSYPLDLVGPLMPGVSDDPIVASAVNFTQKRKVNVTKLKMFRELKHNWTPPPPIKGSILCIWSSEQLTQWDTQINGTNKPLVMLFVKSETLPANIQSQVCNAPPCMVLLSRL